VRGSIVVAVGVLAIGCTTDIEPPGGVNDPSPNADPQAGCALGCHGDDNTNAPPMGLAAATMTTQKGVGAHRAHMDPQPTWHKAVACADCHVVPELVSSPGHIDGDNVAEVTFSARAGSSMWNGTTCTTGCHGSAAFGGTAPTPTWTRVDGTQSQCGSCHGAPPPPPHPAGSNCASCHPTMEENSLTFRDPASHIDGKVDLTDPTATGGCTSCHGSAATNSAPPKALDGSTTGAKVGAHQAHLATSNWHKPVVCTSCHVVPLTQSSPGHIDGDNTAEVIFDTLNPMGAYAAGTCSTNYCHGNGRGNTGTIAWTTPGPLPCTGCHPTNGTNMSGDHRKHIVGENMKCSQCHAQVVNAAMTIIDANLHVNGVHEVKMAQGTYNAATRQCSGTGCHGTETW
jgi:predicted CxxxxCH...CXXCH cytochrome family protein